MTRSLPVILAMLSLVGAMYHATGPAAAADSLRPARQVLKRPPSVDHLQLAKRCPPGFKIITGPSTNYGCVKVVIATCRRKYELYQSPYVTRVGTGFRFIYLCRNTTSGNSPASAQDCTSGFRKTSEVPRRSYRCYLPFKPRCQAGLTAGPALVHEKGNEISVRYYCKRNRSR